MSKQSAETIHASLGLASAKLIEVRAHLMNATNEATDAEERDGLRESLRDLEGLVNAGLTLGIAAMREWRQKADERGE